MRSFLSLTLLALSIGAHGQVIDLNDNNPLFDPIDGGFCRGVFKNKVIWTTYSVSGGATVIGQSNMFQCGNDNKLKEVFGPGGGANPGHAHMPDCPVINGKMYFSHRLDTAASYRLCSWDGVTSPIFLEPDNDSKCPQKSVALDNKLYFINCLDAGATSVVMYDPVSSTYQTLPSSLDTTSHIIPYHGKLYCIKDLYQWSKEGLFYVYDPATNGVSLVAGSSTSYGVPRHILELNNKLYFTAASKPGITLALYEYDGTNAPKKISGSLSVSNGGSLQYKTIGFYKDEIYFSADTLTHGKNLYKYNPQSGTLTYVHTFFIYASSNFIVHKGRMLFLGCGELVPNAELWQYDGVAAPTLLVDINGTTAGSFPFSITAANETIYFIARGSSGVSIFRLAGGLDVLELADAVEEVKLYPNPAADIATLSFNLKKNATVSAVISDMTGKEVYRLTQEESAGTAQMLLDINKLTPGNYTYRLMADERKMLATGKFTKI